ncbi:hypothetical protein CERZMDRAFT_95336 [Cercospora zeae-maydis SCOH1-5]|uniref:Cell wall protein n=1 Tax=Cercospora zeae-maydis SCOH1-5 TaxID=717836 RepID=A0A6A6FNI2_9PEZI|nr:hypothetical protein CERZMDRAFT_95336 [Cercospora zeae-maydis SCOH1-5]
MKFFAVLFATQALAFSLDTRSPAIKSRQAAADIVSAIRSIQSATTNLNTAIDSGDLLALASGNTGVIDAIRAATSQVNGLSTLSFDDAAGLANPIQDLGAAVDTTISNLISKRSSLDGVREAVLTGLEDQQAASLAFSRALLSKIPENLLGIAQNLAQPIADNLARGISAFSSSSSGGGGGGAAATTPEAGAMTTPAPVQASVQASRAPVSAAGSAMPNAPAGNGYTMPTVTTVTGIPSYSLPGSTPSAYTGAAQPMATFGVGAFAVAAVVAAAF